MAQTAYPEKIIDSGLLNVFQTVYDSERNLLASLDEHSGEVSYLDGTNFELKEKVSLPDSAVYRTIDVHNGLTIVNSILKESEVTTSIVSFIGKDFSLKSQWRKQFAGSHLGLYFHKIKIVSVEPSGLPVIGMISHHFHSPGVYFLGIDPKSKELFELASFRGVHSKWLWDIAYVNGTFYVTSSDGLLSVYSLTQKN